MVDARGCFDRTCRSLLFDLLHSPVNNASSSMAFIGTGDRFTCGVVLLHRQIIFYANLWRTSRRDQPTTSLQDWERRHVYVKIVYVRCTGCCEAGTLVIVILCSADTGSRFRHVVVAALHQLKHRCSRECSIRICQSGWNVTSVWFATTYVIV